MLIFKCLTIFRTIFTWWIKVGCILFYLTTSQAYLPHSSKMLQYIDVDDTFCWWSKRLMGQSTNNPQWLTIRSIPIPRSVLRERSFPTHSNHSLFRTYCLHLTDFWSIILVWTLLVTRCFRFRHLTLTKVYYGTTYKGGVFISPHYRIVTKEVVSNMTVLLICLISMGLCVILVKYISRASILLHIIHNIFSFNNSVEI